MPTSAETSDSRWAVDTSVAVAALDASHVAHETCRAAVRELRPRLAGHAAFETFSVLTRMPGALAVAASDAIDALDVVFPDPIWLGIDESRALFARLRTLGLTGGAVYDGLVGTAAKSQGCRLLTRDRRAGRTYDLLGVETHQLG